MSRIWPTQFAIFQSVSGTCTLKCYVSFRIVEITQVLLTNLFD